MIEALVDRSLVTPAVITLPENEQMLQRTDHLRREAYALFCGLLEDFGLMMENTGTISGTITDPDGQAIPGALVVLDEAFALQTGPEGQYRFVFVESGTRAISVYRDGLQAARSTFRVGAGKEIAGDFVLTPAK